MFRVFAPLTFVLGVALLPLLPAQDKPVQRKKIAVLIGVNDYTDNNLPSLKYCEKDILKLKETLEPLGFQIVLLLGSEKGDKEASRQNIYDTLLNDDEANKKFAFRDVTHDDDVVLVAFAGHGEQIPILKNGKEAEVPFYCPKRAKHGVPETLISINDVLTKLADGKGKSLVLVDACRKFTVRRKDDGSRGFRGANMDRAVISALRKNVGGMFACDDRQEALEHEVAGGGHGLFFYSVIESIKTTPKDENGVVTWEDIVPKVRRQVASLTAKVPNLADRDKQTPQAFGNWVGEVVLVPIDVELLPPDSTPKAGEERSLDLGGGVKLVMCYIPKGECQLGSPKAERDAVFAHLKNDKEHPEWLKAEAEEVRGKFKTNGFWLAKFECTQEQYERLMGKNPSYFDGSTAEKGKGQTTSRFPVEQVSWNDAQDFLAKLNEVAGRQKAFGTSKKFVLPHEDQWEYAYRGGRGNTRPFYWGNSLSGDKANHDGNYSFGTTDTGNYFKRPTVVGEFATKASHPWGLCDMAGNVWEWCENKYSNDSDSRVLRGGSWLSDARYCRGAYRLRNGPANRGNIDDGFRVCLPLD